MAVPFVGSLFTFVVALLVGGLAIYVGASVIVGEKSYTHALVTALLGAIAWALTAWIPFLGPILALVVWVGVVNWRYEGGWVTAAAIGVVAWLAAVVILFVLNAVLRIGTGAFGIPGV